MEVVVVLVVVVEVVVVVVVVVVKCRPQHKNPKKGLPNSQTPRSGTLIRVLMLRPFSTSSGKEKKSKL